MILSSWMRGFLLVFLLTLAVAAQSLPVKFVERNVIEARLREVPQKNRAREELLRRRFEESGCGANLEEQKVRGSGNPNLICTLPGELDRVIVVGAHFDFVDAGTGIIDNWSGSSLLPALYAGLKRDPVRHRFVFTAFTDEEKGLVGSAYYVHHLPKQDLAKISAMVNMDSLGTAPSEAEITRGDQQLLQYLSIAAGSLKVPLTPMSVHQVGRSDSDSFQDKHVPTVNLHSLNQRTFGYLHSREDRVAHVDFAAYYDSYRLIAVYLAYLDRVLDPAPQNPSAAGPD